MDRPFLLKTDRLMITEFDAGMTDSVHQNSLDSDNRRFVPDEVFETAAEARDAIAFLMSQYGGEEGPFVYPVLLKDGTHIGHVQAAPVKNGWEIGYHIGAAYTGRGYATEAVAAFVPRIMDVLCIEKLYGICRGDNPASRRVLEKCGFALEWEGVSAYHGGKHPVCRYSKRREDL